MADYNKEMTRYKRSGLWLITSKRYTRCTIFWTMADNSKEMTIFWTIFQSEKCKVQTMD